MPSKLLLTLQGLVPPYFSLQHTHLVTLWFKISWWWRFISMIWHQRTPTALAVFFCWSPSLTRLPVVPLVACLPLPLCLGRLVSALCLGIRHLPYGLQVSALWLLSWEAFPSQHYHKDCPQKVLVQPSPAPYHLTTVRQSFTSGMLRGGQRYYCTWLAALTLEPDDLRSNPSSTTRCLIWQGTYSLEASASHLWSWQNNRLVWFKWINLLRHFRTMPGSLWELKY